jgi:tripartite-type tricarboxylate transporter receptor subunit TctC
VKPGFYLVRVTLIFAALGFAFGSAWAQQNYPSKPIRVIVPWPGGGNIDAAVRVISPKLAQSLGQQFVIDNRPGAGGMIGSELAARAAPDGYTLLAENMTSHAINPPLYGKLPFDTERDYAPIRMMVTIPHILVAHPSLPAKNMKELIALAKARPGELNYASFGAGTTSHLAGEMLKIMTHINIVHVPYKGGPAALTDTIAGNVPLYFTGIAITIPYVNSGRLRALAVLTLARSPLMPNVPTMVEAANLPGYEVASRIVMVAPTGTPKNVLERLSNAVAGALQAQDVRQKIAAMGLEIVSDGAPEHFLPWFQSERAKWTKVIREAGIRAEK